MKMNLYRFEVTIKEELIHVIIAADSDEKAFQLVDIELEKRFLKMPEVDDISLYEKRKINNGTGYVLSEFETIL
ncbi:UNVERIFIED_ORG: AICAR transformylase/IMP cyclohydrolase PurH [Peribacillus simplex]